MRISTLVLAAGSNDWIVYAVGGVLVVYMVARPLLRKKKPDPLESVPRLSLAQQRSIERDMQNVLVELSEMSRQITAQIDTRTAKLDALVQEADAKIAELKRLIEQQDGKNPLDAYRASDLSPQPAEDPTDRYLRHLSAADPRAGTSSTSTESKYHDVYALSDAGRSPQEIAQQLGRPRGEVELILALRPR